VRGRSKAKVTSREKTSVRAWESPNRDGETLDELETNYSSASNLLGVNDAKN
jgi:hypothetical protein